MYEHDGVCYAGDRQPMLRISGVCPLPDFRLWVRFSTGETRLLDCKPVLIELPAFAPLADPDTFRRVYLDVGTVVWNGGQFDLSPDYIYRHSVPAPEDPYADPTIS